MTPKEQQKKFLESIKPVNSFAKEEGLASPDYLADDSWAALPGKDGCHLLSPDAPPTQELKDFDVFYIHPTGYFRPHWNAPLDVEAASYERTDSMLATQASAFASSCNVFAPYYRQATYFSFFDQGGDAEQALDLAYSDIVQAFEEFLEHRNNGRPFIIAAHSQGSLHGQRLVHEKISRTPHRDRFIAAYLIGYILPTKFFDVLYPDLIVSKTPTDQQSIITWCTGTEVWSPSGWSREKMEQPLVCQNPMTWNLEPGWTSDESLVSIRLKSSNLFLSDYHATKHSHAKLSVEAVTDKSFEARLSNNNMVETRGPLIERVEKLTAGGDLHSFDVSLFWGSIRSNVALRTNAFNK